MTHGLTAPVRALLNASTHRRLGQPPIQACARADLGGPGAYGRRFDDRAFAGPITMSDGRRAWLALVADGVGGGPVGGHAADLVVEAVLAHLTTQPGGDDILSLLGGAALAAHAAVRAAGQTGRADAGLASTLAAALVVDARLFVVNVGDSRVYVLASGRLAQVSSDHVWWRSAVAEGRAAIGHARRHPRADELSRAVGLEPEPDLGLYLRGGPTAGEDPETARANQGLQLGPGDRVLVCSDGLIKPRWDRPERPIVSDGELRDQLLATNASDAVHALIGLARGRGADDNVSAAVLAVAGARRPRLNWRIAAVVLLTGLISAVAASSSTLWWLAR